MGRRVLIVGAGVVGLSVALQAARKGLEVTVVDRDATPGEGCSYGNAGMLVPSHFVPLAAPGAVALGLRWMLSSDSPFWIRPRPSLDLLGWGLRFWRSSTAAHVARAAPLLRDLHLASRETFVEWAKEWGSDFDLHTGGMLMLCRTAHGLEEEVRAAAHARELGVPAEVLDRAAASAAEPELRMDVAGAVRYPLDAHLSPKHLMAALAAEAEKAGARLVRGVSVKGWRAQETRVDAALTTAGAIAADAFVLAGGIWSDALVRDLGLRIPMQAGRGYSLTLDTPARRPRHCAILSEARVAVTPMGKSLRVGGTMEMTGVDAPQDLRRVRGIVRSFVRYFPEFTESDFSAITPWAGLRPVSPDGLPYVGPFARFPNLVAATGHAMMGVSLAPATGRLVAEMLAGEPASWDVSALAPDRHA